MFLLLQTTQLVESVMDCEEGELPTGLVVANDSDNTRCYMLTHQVLYCTPVLYCSVHLTVL